MTVKNLLKTAVLGIAFCSVFEVNHSVAMNNNNQYNEDNSIEVYKQQLRDIFYKVYSYNDEGDPGFSLLVRMPLWACNGYIDPRTDEPIKAVFSKITHIINKALYNKLDAIDLDILKDSINVVKSNITTSYHDSNYERDCNIISKNANKIINAVSKIYYSTPHLT